MYKKATETEQRGTTEIMYRILLVDDEILVRDAIRENIDWKAMDCELVGDCDNGKAAAEFVQTHPVDIVLTDILMPYMDGMELSHFLHDNYPDIVIVIFSGFGEFEYAKKAIQYDVSEYMLKPVTAMELRAVIEKMKKKVDQRREEKQKIERLTQTSENYQKNAIVIRSRALQAFVENIKTREESLEELSGLGISLEAACYRVAAFDLDLYSDGTQITAEKRQESALMSFVLFNVSDEIVSREKAGVAYQEGNNKVCVLFMGNRTREFGEKIMEICQMIQSKLKELMALDVSISVGSWARTQQELLVSHELAEKGIEYRYLLGGRLLIDMEEQPEENTLSIKNVVEALVTALKTGRKENADYILEKISSDIKAARVDKSRACVYLQQIIRAADETCEDMVPDSKLFSKREALLQQVTEQNSFDSAFELVKSHVGEIFQTLSDANSSSGQRQARLALDYIQKNYMDPDLSLNSICSYLNISTSYFSTIFKDLTGETFTEVLIRTRMEKAKELLENTTMKNYEIAEKVGFADPHYFGISFKKMTGCTPTEYAREKRK